MTPEERARAMLGQDPVVICASSDIRLAQALSDALVGTYADAIREAEAAARLQAFEEAAKIAERHLPAGMYPEALAGAIAAAIRQHAKGDWK